MKEGEREGGKRGVCLCVCGMGHRWLLFSIYFCPPLLVSSFPCPSGLGRQKFFPLLCHHQEIIICCSVFHTDNHDWLPHAKFKNRTNNTFVYSMPLCQMLPWVAVVICFLKQINDISALGEIKSIHYDCAWVGSEAS